MDGRGDRIPDLLARLRAEGDAALREALGPYVLVGAAHDAVDEGGWSFATHVVGAREETPSRPFDLDASIVHGLRKRGSTFAGVILVGRSSSNDVCIDDTTISKLHARVRIDAECFWVEDAGSRNGTFVDGERIRSESAVYPGDTIRFGNVAFRVHETGRFLDVLRRMGR